MSLKDDPNFDRVRKNIKFISEGWGMTTDEALDYVFNFTIKDPAVNVESMRGTFDIIREILLEEERDLIWKNV